MASSAVSIVFTILAPLLVLVLIGAGIVALQRGRLTFATIVHAYTAIVLGVCIVLALVGGAFLLKSLLSSAISRDFSYQTQDYPFQPPDVPGPRPPGPTAAQRAETQARDDIATGITLLVVGVGLGVLHVFGKVAAARRDREYAGLVQRGFDVVMLGIATVGGLVSLAMALNDLLRRYVLTSADRDPYNVPHPGGALAYAIMFVPLWIYFARRVWRALLGGEPAAPAAPLAPPESTAAGAMES